MKDYKKELEKFLEEIQQDEFRTEIEKRCEISCLLRFALRVDLITPGAFCELNRKYISKK